MIEVRIPPAGLVRIARDENQLDQLRLFCQPPVRSLAEATDRVVKNSQDRHDYPSCTTVNPSGATGGGPFKTCERRRIRLKMKRLKKCMTPRTTSTIPTLADSASIPTCADSTS